MATKNKICFLTDISPDLEVRGIIAGRRNELN